MGEFTVLLYRDDAVDATLTQDAVDVAWAAHAGFQQLCADRGWTLTATRALGPAARARALRSDGAGGIVATDGPYTETAEQVGGFYLVDGVSLDELSQAVGALVLNGESVEIRPTEQFENGKPVVSS